MDIPETIVRDSQLPPDVQPLPRHARRVWKAAWNSQHSATAAWLAVHGKYEPADDGKWHRKPEAGPEEDDGPMTADAHETPGLNHFVALAKVDINKREVWGWAAEEAPDNAGEIMDYTTSKPYWMDWSKKVQKASGGKSVGNLRLMHTLKTIGKLIHLEPKDELRKFWVGAYISDDQALNDFKNGVLNGFSVGGDYVRTWRDPSNPLLKRYTAKPVELSAVDSPCMAGAVVEFIKADGSATSMTVPPQGAKMPDEPLKKNDQVNEDGVKEDAVAAAPVGDEDVKPTGDEGGGEEPVMPHDKAVEMLQEIRNAAEAEGNFEEADLLTQAITLAVGARDMNSTHGPSDAVEGVAEGEAAEDEGDGDEMMAKVVAANKLAKVGAMLNAQNMSGIHAIIRALAEMAGRAGDDMGKRIAAMYQDAGSVSQDGAAKEDAQAAAQAVESKDAGPDAKQGEAGSKAVPVADQKAPSDKIPSGKAPAEGAPSGDGSDAAAADEGKKKPPFMKKVDEVGVDERIVRDLATIVTFVEGLETRLAKVESMPASTGPALRMVPIHQVQLDGDEQELVNELAKASDIVTKAQIQSRLDMLRIKKAQQQAHPLRS